jgi:flavin-binding protein dodecin
MADSVYRVFEVIGTSTKSWEDAATSAIKMASKSLRDLRVAEVIDQDLVIDNGKVEAFRTKLRVSFKLEASGGKAKKISGAITRDYSSFSTLDVRQGRAQGRAVMSPAGEIGPHSGECGPTPKEQPPPETLRQKDRRRRQTLESGRVVLAVRPTEGVIPAPCAARVRSAPR